MKSLKEQAYIHIRNMIANNKFSYHEIYSETKVAEEIGISRTPCRDAIHRLVQEGILEIIPSKGFRLYQLTLQDVEETFQVRSALESYCTMYITKEYVTERAQQLFIQLQAIMDRLKLILDTSHSIEDFYHWDLEFHILIMNYMENKTFTSTFQTILYKMQKLAFLSLSHENRMEETYIEHLNILKTMKSGNVNDIYPITLLHLDNPKNLNIQDLSDTQNYDSHPML